MTTYPYRPRMEIEVNGLRRRGFVSNVAMGASSPIAQATITGVKSDGEVAGGDIVRVRMGYVGAEFDQVFEGEVRDDSLEHWPNGLSFSVQGYLARAEYSLGTEDEEALMDLDTGEVAPLREWIGITDGVIIADLLDMVGIPRGPIVDLGVVLGEVEPIRLLPSASPLSLIQAIDEALGCVTLDWSDGTVRRVVYSGIPSGAPSLVLRKGVNLLGANRSRSSSDVINRVTVTGAENAFFTPSAKLSSPSAVSPTTGKPYIPTPPGYRNHPYSSTILDTEDLCAAYAARVLGERNRLTFNVPVQLPRGYIRLHPTQSLYLQTDTLDFDSGTIFWIDSVTHRADAKGIKTDLVLRGAYEAEGVNANLPPIPAFTLSVKKETIRNMAGVMSNVWIILADASGTSDPDGAYIIPASVNEEGMPIAETSFNGISLLTWSSTLGVTPSLSPGSENVAPGTRATWVVDVNPDGETITLTAYDMQGSDASLTKTVQVNASRPALVRDLWLAMGTVLYFTNDGEFTWQAIDVPAVFVCEMAAYDYNLALDAAGTVYRITSALVVTEPPTAPANATAASIRWDYPETKVQGARAWLGCADGRIFFSSDRGVTWAHAATLAGAPSITSIVESPFAENDIWVSAANKFFHSYDGVGFEAVYSHPNTALIAANMTSGFNLGYGVFKGADGGGAEASRVRERFNEVVGDWDRDGVAAALPTGEWRVSYAFRGEGGTGPASPVTAVTVGANQAIQVNAISTSPQGATGVVYYLSEGPSSLVLREVKRGLTGQVVVLTEAPDGAAELAPTTDTTELGLGAPFAGPTLTAIAAVAGPIDFPVQAAWATIGIDTPTLMVVGTSPTALTGMSWVAEADAAFTFARGEYDTAMGVPRHAIRDGNFPGIAYGAAVDAAFKTTSYFRDDCFPIKPAEAGEEGWMIGYGDLHALEIRGNLVWIGTGSILHGGARYVYRLTSLGITRVLHPLSGVVSEAGIPDHLLNIELHATSNGVLISVANQSTNGTSSHATGAHRSTDGGVTWVAITDLVNPSVIATGPDGNVYAACYNSIGDGFLGHTLWRSTDDGASFTQVHSIGNSGVIATRYNALAVHPDNPLVVLSKSYGNTAGASNRADNPRSLSFYLSSDGGVTWTYLNIGPLDQAGIGDGQFATLSPAGTHILWTPQDVSPRGIHRAPATVGGVRVEVDPGFTTMKATPMAVTADAIYAYGDAGVAVSIDDGVTWSAIFEGDDGDVQDALSFVPGDTANEWYVLPYNVSNDVALLTHAEGTLTGDWVDMTATLYAQFPDGQFFAYRRAAVRFATE